MDMKKVIMVGTLPVEERSCMVNYALQMAIADGSYDNSRTITDSELYKLLESATDVELNRSESRFYWSHGPVKFRAWKKNI